MPLYEYYCAECRSKFDLLVSYEASASDVVCTKCHKTNVRKLFSVFASPRGGGDMSDFADGGESDGFGDDFDSGCGPDGCGSGGCGCND